MKIFITGASGFVGAHSALELLARGHQVRLLVRSPRGVGEYFSRHGHVVDDFVIGDMRDGALIASSMRGCDAVLHAAALVSVDPRRADEIYRNNVAGIEAVIGTACRLGIARIVYVSSLSVLFQKGIDIIDEQVRLGEPTEAYARSKRDCDVHVRAMQDRGCPVQMTYPAGIIGPDDPRLSEANFAVASFLKAVPQTSSGIQFVDVRDLAIAHRYLLENMHEGSFESARYIAGGHYFAWSDLHATLERLTGRAILAPRVPGKVLRAVGSLTDGLRKLIPFQTHMTREAMGYVTEWVPADSRRVLAQAGMRFRSAEETFTDTIRWLASAGHIPVRLAGRLADDNFSNAGVGPAIKD